MREGAGGGVESVCEVCICEIACAVYISMCVNGYTGACLCEHKGVLEC